MKAATVDCKGRGNAMSEHNDVFFGGLVISPEVIAKIAITAAKDVEGVGALVPCKNDFRRYLRFRSALGYVKINGGDQDMRLVLALTLRPGAQIKKVGAQVQRQVKEAIQNMTGKTVTQVNVHIAGVA
jgi:uncharacterized alkaline shock family protein YloU